MLGLENLDARTRFIMNDEAELDENNGKTFRNSPLLTQKGQRDFPDLLKQAALGHDEAWFADELRKEGRTVAAETRRQHGVRAQVYDDAIALLAEQEFNRLYCRAICRRAWEHGVSVEIYRASPGPEIIQDWDTWLFMTVPPKPMLDNLRSGASLDRLLNIPAGRRSGFSLRCQLPEEEEDAEDG